MNKKLICLLLSLIMVLSVALTGCSQKDSDEAISNTADKASESTITLAMYLVSENKVSKEQATAIQNAVNKITKAKFKTQLLLYFFTEDTYYEAVDAAFEKYDEAKELGTLVKDELSNKKDEATTGTVEEETVVNEYGVVELKFPEIPSYQIDIMYLSGYENLIKYTDGIEDEETGEVIFEGDRLADLTDEIKNASTILKSYISPDYLTRMDEICNNTYGIPTNAPIGEYTYLLFNKELLAKYNNVISDFSSLSDIDTEYFLETVKDFEKDYVPLRSFTENELDVINTVYFGTDASGHLTQDFSIFGGTADPSYNYLERGSCIAFKNIFTDKDFVKKITDVVSYREKGYYGTEADADKPFAVGYMKGDATIEAIYGDEYEFVVLETPRFTPDDLFSNMFAVTQTSTDIARSMEIVTYLNTNTEFRNLILYGIEGENYELRESEPDENGKTYNYVKRLNEDYMMAPEKTGNMCIIYPLEGQPLNLTDCYKKQNAEAKTYSMYSFTYLDYTDPIAPELIEATSEYSAEVLAKINSINTVKELEDYISEVSRHIKNDETLKAAAANTYGDPESEIPEEFTTLHGMYNTWIVEKGLGNS